MFFLLNSSSSSPFLVFLFFLVMKTEKDEKTMFKIHLNVDFMKTKNFCQIWRKTIKLVFLAPLLFVHGTTTSRSKYSTHYFYTTWDKDGRQGKKTYFSRPGTSRVERHQVEPLSIKHVIKVRLQWNALETIKYIIE